MPPAAANPDTDAALRENRWSNHVRVFRIFARVTNAKLWHYWLPLLMTLIAAGLEGASMALLLPEKVRLPEGWRNILIWNISIPAASIVRWA